MDFSAIEGISPENIPLDFVKQYLRVDHDLDDIEIMVALRSAIAYVKKYIKAEDEEQLGDDLVMPVLVLVSHFYESKSLMSKSNERIDRILSAILDMNRNGIL